jgi:hypothetical protein
MTSRETIRDFVLQANGDRTRLEQSIVRWVDAEIDARGLVTFFLEVVTELGGLGAIPIEWQPKLPSELRTRLMEAKADESILDLPGFDEIMERSARNVLVLAARQIAQEESSVKGPRAARTAPRA